MRALAFTILLAGCGGEEESARADGLENKVEAPAQPPPSAEDAALSSDAAASLRLYYDHLARREWRAAFAMRASAPGLTLERFAANYERYEAYLATVGAPSLPARQDGAVWVQIPVQLYGRMRDGSPFGSVGMMVLRREERGGRWTILS